MLKRFRLQYLSKLQCRTTSINQLKQLHAHLIANGLKSPSVLAKLVESYNAVSSSQGTHYAYLILNHFETPNVYLLNVLIRSAPPRQSILVFSSYVSNENIIFDDFTFIFVLGACVRSDSASWEGKQIHSMILKRGFLSNIMIQTTIIHFYGSLKDINLARKLFEEMPHRNSVSYNAMITGYCSHKERNSVYAKEGFVLFREMLIDNSGAKPTDTTIVCVLSLISNMGVLESGICLHGYIEKTVLSPEYDVFLGTSLIDMYSKCGCLRNAFSMFNVMKERNVLTWTAMMTGLAIHGRGEESLNLLNLMAAYNLRPNEVTFTCLLSACCHSGLLEEGLLLFHMMESKFKIKSRIQHYGCIVDLLGRAGHLKEAYEFINEMRIEGDAILWRSLLSACKVHGDVLMAEKVGKLLLKVKPTVVGLDFKSSTEDYVALSNFYASAEKWTDVEMVRWAIKDKGRETRPGCSFVSI